MFFIDALFGELSSARLHFYIKDSFGYLYKKGQKILNTR